MITVRLEGGLGNQLFQYALGRTLALKHKTKLLLDLGFYQGNTDRSFQLDSFAIHASIASVSELKKSLSVTSKVLDIFKPRFMKRIVREAGAFVFDPNILSLSDEKYLIGHWQNEHYFKEIEDTLRKELTLSTRPGETTNRWLERIRSKRSASLHVRRSDYLTNEKFHATYQTLSPSYYAQAMKHIAGHTPDTIFFVFSDDINWAKENITSSYPLEFVSSKDTSAAEDLTLMSLCQNNIIANSSFSWWAAWLNRNTNKIVIAPKQWLKDSRYNTSEIVPRNWQKI